MASNWSWVVPLALVVLAAIAAGYARRGRRVDDHPVCRRCGFDLFGKPAGSSRCGECGADLAGRRAVRVGNRRRRDGLARASLAVLVPAAAWLGVGGYRAARSTDWNRHKPLWWVMREVDGSGLLARDAALRELGRRIGTGTLPDADTATLVDRALAAQADAGKPWSPAWGEVVEAAQAARRCPLERWKRYQSQAVTFAVEVPGQDNRTGDPLTVRLLRGPDRVGAARFSLELSGEVRKVAVDGRPAGSDIEFANYTGLPPSIDVPAAPGTGPVGGLLARAVYQTERAGPGPHTVAWPVTVRVPVPGADGLAASLAVLLFADRNLGARTHDVTGSFALKGPGDPSPDGGDGAAALAAWSAGLRCDRLTFDGSLLTGTVTPATPPPRFTRVVAYVRPAGAVGTATASAPVATRVAEAGDHGADGPEGELSFSNDEVESREFSVLDDKWKGETADVVLRVKARPGGGTASAEATIRNVAVRLE